MLDATLLQTLGQVSSGEAGQVFREHIRAGVLQMIGEVISVEVAELCGPKHLPDDGDMYRAGSSPGRVLVDGQREPVTRPRVRQRLADGS